MKYYGDVPQEHLELVNELNFLEELIDKHIEDFSPLALAKGMVCLGADYYSIHFDEEGNRLFKRAEGHCPGYFSGPIYSDMKKDEEFELLISLIDAEEALDLMASLGYKVE